MAHQPVDDKLVFEARRTVVACGNNIKLADVPLKRLFVVETIRHLFSVMRPVVDGTMDPRYKQELMAQCRLISTMADRMLSDLNTTTKDLLDCFSDLNVLLWSMAPNNPDNTTSPCVVNDPKKPVATRASTVGPYGYTSQTVGQSITTRNEHGYTRN